MRMRKESFFGSPREAAVSLLARAGVVHLAMTGPDDHPVLRAMHAVVLDDAIWFHGAPVGEKAECAGRPAVVSAEELVCELPSWFFGTEKGCPAASFYRSAQAHGVVEEVEARAAKAHVLQAFMEKYQPEGRHARVDEGPLYGPELDGVLVLRLPLARVHGKEKVGQDRPPEELTRILEQLWARGAPGDAAAIDAIRDANPALEDPPFLASAQGVRLRCALGPESLDEVEELLAGKPWLAGVSREAIRRAHRTSQAWVGARSAEGDLVGSVRGLSDGEVAILTDLSVARAWRGLGIGKALLRLLLDHPAVRPCRTLRLFASEAHALYDRFGFLTASFRRKPGGLGPVELVLEREGGS
jgi:nitroimidazol reductase NimA-like FMN-containing flavoprotein (pyridoxamine 5'-phosphate oxidase superfamily)/ribosomal protein S18 acetylase RimI-like enzyme